MKIIPNGIYPTMITPFTKDNKIDFDLVEKITEWYIEKGCEGIFAVCQSSELLFLSLEERIALAKKVSDVAKGRACVVASGHVADSIDDQAYELTAINQSGVDAVVLITNRLDINNQGDKVWIENAEKLLKKLPDNITLGMYECPRPYKRLLTPEILKYCISTGKFAFIKDTCCDINMLTERLKILNGTGIKLYNANAQSLLFTLQNGGAGYSGIMANFHPELYIWLCNNFEKEPERAAKLERFLSLYAFTESLSYPVTAKYHMRLDGINIGLETRTRSMDDLSEYDKYVINQQYPLEKELIKEYI